MRRIAAFVALLLLALPLPAQTISLKNAGIADGASLAIGSSTYTADQAAAINAILAINDVSGAPLTVIWDVRCAIGASVTPGANDHIIGANGGGAILLPMTHPVPLIANKNQSFGVGGSNGDGGVGHATAAALGNFTDHDITIENLILNGNIDNQPGGQISGVTTPQGLAVGMQFFGVDNLLVQNCQIRRTCFYATHFANTRKARVIGCVVDQGASPNFGTDGYHFQGPTAEALIADCTASSGDDCWAFNSSDGNMNSVPSTPPLTYWPFPGPMTDCEVRNFTCRNNKLGFRILSSDQLFTRFRLTGQHGTCQAGIGLVSSFRADNGAAQTQTPGDGNVSEITLSDIDVDVTADSATNTDGYQLGNLLLEIAANDISVLNWNICQPSAFTKPKMYVSGARIGYLPIRRLTVTGSYIETTSGNVQPIVYVNNDVNMLVAQFDLYRQGIANANSPFVQVNTGDSTHGIKTLLWRGTANNVNRVVDLVAGKHGTVQLSGNHVVQGGGSAITLTGGQTLTNSDCRQLLAVSKTTGGTITNNIDTGGTYADPP